MNFVLQPGEPGVKNPKSSRRITVQQLLLPPVRGLTIRAEPDWLADKKGNVTNLEVFDQGRLRCNQAMRKFTCLVKSGNPDYQPPVYGRLFDSIVNKYVVDPDFWGLHLTGFTPDGVSEELHWQRISVQVENHYRWLINAIPLKVPRVLIAISPKDVAGCKRIVMMAGARFGKHRVVPKINSLHAGSKMAAPQVRLLIELGKMGYPIGFEDTCSAVDRPDRYEGTAAQGEAVAKQICTSAGQFYSEAYHARYQPDLPVL